MPHISFRVGPELDSKIEAAVVEETVFEDRSQFCRAAIREYLEKRQSDDFDSAY